MKTAVMRARGVPPEAPKGNRRRSTDCTGRRSRNQRRWGETPSSLLLGRVELSDSGGSTESRPTIHKSSRASRILQDSNTERPKAASSREALVELIVASLADTPHAGRRIWQNRPRRGRRRPVAGRSFFPAIMWSCFSKRTQMMAPAKLGKTPFSTGNRVFRCSRAGKKKVFLRNEPK